MAYITVEEINGAHVGIDGLKTDFPGDPVNVQKLPITNSGIISSAFKEGVSLLKLTAEEDCYFTIGTLPQPENARQLLQGRCPTFFEGNAGQMIAVKSANYINIDLDVRHLLRELVLESKRTNAYLMEMYGEEISNHDIED